MINKVTLVGNVGSDPEIRTMPNGNKVANFSLATSDSWKDKDGNRQEKTEWHRVVTFREPLIKIIEQYIFKGSKLYIEGSLKTRKYTDSNDIERYTTEIIIQNYGDVLRILDNKSTAPKGKNDYDDGSHEVSNSDSGEAGFNDDDIPF